MKKKGQYALEFLMTYGWAFLVVIVLIGLLGYFGIIGPPGNLKEMESFCIENGFDGYRDYSEDYVSCYKKINNVTLDEDGFLNERGSYAFYLVKKE